MVLGETSHGAISGEIVSATAEAEAEAPQSPPDKAEPDKPRSRWPLIILGIVILLAILAGLLYWFLTRNQVSTDDAYTDGRAVTIAPHVSGYVVKLLVNDNQRVRAGDVLIEIERSDYLAAREQARGQLDAAQAQLDNARIALDKARTTYPARLQQTQGQLEQARGGYFRAEADARRQHLIERAATSQQDIDTATAAQRQAAGQVAQAEGQVAEARLVPQDIAQADAQVHQWEGQVLQAKAALDQAEINLAYTKVVAPGDGWITKRNVERGNLVQVGVPIFSIVEPEIWVTANFKEDQLNRMRPGQAVAISVDAYPGLRLAGHVDSIQLGSGAKFTAFPAENATGNYVKIVQRVPVKIVIDRGLDPNLPLPLGISVEPTVTLP